MRLVKIEKSDRPGKKWMAVFEQDTGRMKTTHFGAAGMNDFTLTGDKEARARYRTRHAKDLNTGDPTRAGFLSYHILWGNSKNMDTNITAFKRTFHL